MTEKEVSNKIDELINQLKKDLLNVPYSSRGVWDRVKNWWQNLTKKPDNPANPYYLTNKFGSLGRMNPNSNIEPINNEPEEKEEEIPSEEDFKLGTSKSESRISLKQYTVLREASNNLEKMVFSINENQMSDNLKNLEMFRIIDNWAVNFKKQIMNLIKGEVDISTIDSKKVDPNKTDVKLPKSTDGKIPFKSWIKNVDNVHFFLEIVNHIFSDSVRYRKPLMSIVEVLKNKGVASPKKGEEGTPLVISIRNEILRMIKKEVEVDAKPDDSVFKPAVWSWAKNLPSWKKSKNKEEGGSSEFEEEPPPPVAISEPGGKDDESGEFLNI